MKKFRTRTCHTRNFGSSRTESAAFLRWGEASQQKRRGQPRGFSELGENDEVCAIVFSIQNQIRWFSPSLPIVSFVFRRKTSRDACICRKPSRPPKMRTRVRVPRNSTDGALPDRKKVRGEVYGGASAVPSGDPSTCFWRFGGPSVGSASVGR